MAEKTIRITPVAQEVTASFLRDSFAVFSISKIHKGEGEAFVEFHTESDKVAFGSAYDNDTIPELGGAKYEAVPEDFVWNFEDSGCEPRFLMKEKEEKDVHHTEEFTINLTQPDSKSLVTVSHCDPLILATLKTAEIKERIFGTFSSINRVLKKEDKVIVEVENQAELEQLEAIFEGLRVEKLGKNAIIDLKPEACEKFGEHWVLQQREEYSSGLKSIEPSPAKEEVEEKTEQPEELITTRLDKVSSPGEFFMGHEEQSSEASQIKPFEPANQSEKASEGSANIFLLQQEECDQEKEKLQREEAEERDRQRQEAERLLQEEEKRREEETQRQKEQELKRRREEEEKIKRQRQEEEDRKRKEAEEAERQRIEEQKRREAEEQQRKKEEEETKRREAEAKEIERHREAERKRQEEEMRRREAEAEEAKRKKEEEERKRKEEAEKQRKEEERMLREAQEAERQREEEKKRRETEAEKKREEERIKEEERIRKELEETEKRREQEEILRRNAEEERKRKEVERADEKKAEEEEERGSEEGAEEEHGQGQGQETDTSNKASLMANKTAWFWVIVLLSVSFWISTTL